MTNLRAGWAVGCSIVVFLGCTDALHVGNEPTQKAKVSGSVGATTTWPPASTVGFAGASTTRTPAATGGVAGASTPWVPASTVGVGGASTATGIGLGGSVGSIAVCTADQSLTAQQLSDIQTAACNGLVIEPEPAPLMLGLVIDSGESMTDLVPGNSATKFEILRDALNDALLGSTEYAGLPSHVSVGMLLFPNLPRPLSIPTSPTEVDSCIDTSPMAPMNPLGRDEASSHRSLLRIALAQAAAEGGTPTHDAYNFALNNLMFPTGAVTNGEERRLLLITDGQPTYYKGCYNPSGQMQDVAGEPILASVQYARSLGIQTYVIGLPGSETARPWLSKAAALGGSAAAGCDPDSISGPFCHSDLTQPDDLGGRLRATLKQQFFPVGICGFQLPGESADGTSPVDMSRMAPLLKRADGSVRQLRNNTGSTVDCSTGYRLLDTTTMVLGAATCDELYSGGSLSVIFGCNPDELAGTVE